MIICHASTSFFPFIDGGVATHVFNLSKSLVMQGHEVHAIHLRQRDEPLYERLHGIHVHRIEFTGRDLHNGFNEFKDYIFSACHNLLSDDGKYGAGAPHAAPLYRPSGYEGFKAVNEFVGREISQIADEHCADIVHIHDFPFLFAHKYLAKRVAKIITWHVPFPPLMAPTLLDFLIPNLSSYDHVGFLTQPYLDEAVGAGLQSFGASVLWPMANSGIFHGSTKEQTEVAKQMICKSSGRKVILCVQRIDNKSGHEQIVRAMPKVLEQVPDALLVFVGVHPPHYDILKSPHLRRLIVLINLLGIGASVRFLENVGYLSMPQVYAAADVVCLCSKNEGFGLAISEAMHCGKPVIGTNTVGIAAQIKHGLNGFLVGVGDHGATAESIITLLLDDVLCRKMSQASIGISRKFSMQEGTQRHLETYMQLIEKKNIPLHSNIGRDQDAAAVHE